MTAWSATIWRGDTVTGKLWDGSGSSLALTGTEDGKRLYLTATPGEVEPGFPGTEADFYAALGRPGAFLTGFIDRSGKQWSGELALGSRWRLRLSGSSHVDGCIGMRGTIATA